MSLVIDIDEILGIRVVTWRTNQNCGIRFCGTQEQAIDFATDKVIERMRLMVKEIEKEEGQISGESSSADWHDVLSWADQR